MKKFVFYKKNLNTDRMRKHPFFVVTAEDKKEAETMFYEQLAHNVLRENETWVMREVANV